MELVGGVWACGGAMALRREMVAQIGMFEERLFMYCEDVDLAWRAQLAAPPVAGVRVSGEGTLRRLLGSVGGEQTTRLARLNLTGLWPRLGSDWSLEYGVDNSRVELLDRQMKGFRPEAQSVTLFPTAVVERQSTEILAIDDREVARAIRFIRQNAHRPLQVADVVVEIIS
jgi:hypothetical protein